MTFGARGNLESKTFSCSQRSQGDARIVQAPLAHKHVAHNTLDRAECHIASNIRECASNPITLFGRPLLSSLLDAGRMITFGARGNRKFKTFSYPQRSQGDARIVQAPLA